MLALRLLRAVETFVPDGYDPPPDVGQVREAALQILRAQLQSTAPPRKVLPASAPPTVFLTADDDNGIVEEPVESIEKNEVIISAAMSELIEKLRGVAKLKHCFENGIDKH